MSEVKVSEPVAASAAKVWELLGDFGGIAKWGGAMMESCTVEGSGVGAVRTIGLPGGGSIRERLEAYDGAGRSLSYAIIGQSPIPIRNYLSTCRVVETGPNACRVDWEGRFEPVGVSEEQAQGMVRGIYTGGIKAVRKLLGG
jgi:Polyketide cyclase / dehydrase and lipid transport